MIIGKLFNHKYQIGLVFTAIIVLFFSPIYSPRIPDLFIGEEFYSVQNGETFDLFWGWVNYFTANGRLFEGLYFTAAYKLIGFNPRVFRLVGITLHLISVLIFTIVVMRITPKKFRTPFHSFLLSALLFFNPPSMSVLWMISIDHGRIALICTGLSYLLQQEWVRRGFQLRWLLASLASFLAAVFSYEMPAFLFPAGLLFALPLLPEGQIANKRRNQMIGLSIASMFFILAPFFTYKLFELITGNVMNHPVNKLISDPIDLVIQSTRSIWSILAGFGDAFIGTWGGKDLIVPIMMLVILILPIVIEGKAILLDKNKTRISFFWIASGGLWVALMGLLSFALVGYGPTTRVFIGLGYGLPILITMIYSYDPQFLFKPLILAISIFWVWNGIGTVMIEMDLRNSREWDQNQYFLTIAEQVPAIQDFTSFVLLDHKLSDTGCGAAFAMLYDQPHIHCAFLSSTDPEFTAERLESGLNAPGGYYIEDTYIIIALDEAGMPYVVPMITTQDSFLIEWETLEPIVTDGYPFLENTQKIDTQMKIHLEKRQEILEHSRQNYAP